MFCHRPISKFVAFIAAVPLLHPGWQQGALAEEPEVASEIVARSRPVEATVIDIVMLPGNIVAGELRDADDRPIGNAEIAIIRGRETIARGMTDKQGEFAIEVPHGGTFLVFSKQSSRLVRAWTASAAPPKSKTRIHLTASRTIVRGQSPGPGMGMDPFLGLFLVSGVIAAIAIPLAINANDDNDSPRDTTPTGCEPEVPESN